MSTWKVIRIRCSGTLHRVEVGYDGILLLDHTADEQERWEQIAADLAAIRGEQEQAPDLLWGRPSPTACRCHEVLLAWGEHVAAPWNHTMPRTLPWNHTMPRTLGRIWNKIRRQTW